jgi:hypothetical protein
LEQSIRKKTIPLITQLYAAQLVWFQVAASALQGNACFRSKIGCENGHNCPLSGIRKYLNQLISSHLREILLDFF